MQLFRFYLGAYGPEWPEYVVSRDSSAFLVSSQVHMSAECQSVAVAYTGAFLLLPFPDQWTCIS